jgi:class 3 adenylate cyclase
MTEPPELLVAHFMSLGLIAQEDVPVMNDLVRQARETAGVRLEEHDMLGVAQALGRAVERVSAAGADVAIRRLDSLPAEERPAALEAWLDAIMPVLVASFEVLCERRARQIGRRRLLVSTQENHPTPPVAVAFVDLRGSTGFMLDHDPSEIEALTDELYAVGQEVATRHDVAAGKFLGDGVLLVSADTGRLLRAARDAVSLLDTRTELRAGAGVAWGQVIRRAGDWHGPPVNLAARLAELAAADEILVDHTAVADAPQPVARWRDVLPRGLADIRRVAVFTPLVHDEPK